MPEPVPRAFTIHVEDGFRCVKNLNGYIEFLAKPVNTGLVIGLFTKDSDAQNPDYAIKMSVISWNGGEIGLYKETGQIVASTYVPQVLNHLEWKGFWLHISNQTISFGLEKERSSILNWKDGTLEPVLRVGFKVDTLRYLDANEEAKKADIIVGSFTKSEPSGVLWIKSSNGQMPEKAFVGGHDNGKSLFVIRAHLNRSLTPGKLTEGARLSEVSWGCRSNYSENYEVLTDFEGNWKRARDGEVPPLAVLAGISEDNFPLYIGRTSHEGTLTVGKVQPNHGVLYVPYAGQELAFKDYEVLCHKPPGLPVIPRPKELIEDWQPQLKWVYSCNGRAPRNAFFMESSKGKSVVLIRAKKHYWYPGWIFSDGTEGRVAGNFFNINVSEYEVLCDFRGYWKKPTPDSGMPENALHMGKDENDDKIYIGRVMHGGQRFFGSVQRMECHICYDNECITINDFEVLCYPKSVFKNGISTTSNLLTSR